MNTMQQEFDAVVGHLYKQGRPAVMEHADCGTIWCSYRTTTIHGVLSCAVGCRIPDEVYDPEMDEEISGVDGTSLCALIERFEEKLPKEIIKYSAMFNSLQVVHDCAAVDGTGAFVIPKLEFALKDVARKYNMVFTVPVTEVA